MNGNDALLTILLALMALLYSSVGHAGSSGYQAAMGLFDVSSEMMKPIALFLNIVVASVPGSSQDETALIGDDCFGWLQVPYQLQSLGDI